MSLVTANGSERSEREITRLYDQLARYQWWMRRLSRARPGQRLAMRKRLRPGADELAGVEDLNPWLWRLAAAGDEPRVLDLGAGFGDTLLSWARDHRGSFLGLGLSGYQVARANAQANSLGVAQACRFVRQAFDQAIEGSFDLVVSVETLFHAPDVRSTLARVAERLAPGGIIVIVEDMAADADVATTGAGRELLQRWFTKRLHTRADYLEGLREAGLELELDLDLSDLLVLPTAHALQRRRRLLTRLRPCLPIGRAVVDGFLGGLAMEELQRRGDLRYRVLRARRPRASTGSAS